MASSVKKSWAGKTCWTIFKKWNYRNLTLAPKLCGESADEAEEEEQRAIAEKLKGADLKDDPSVGELKDGELDTPNIDLQCQPKVSWTTESF